MGTRCMHYGQIEWGQDAFSRTNPIVRGLICMGTQCTNTEDQCIGTPDVSMEYDVCESTSLRVMLMNPCKWSQDEYQLNEPILWGEQGPCTMGSVP